MKYTVCLGEFTETYEGTVEEIMELKKQTILTTNTLAEIKNTPYLDKLSKGIKTYSGHHGCVPKSIEMNPVYFAELMIETFNSSVIKQTDIGNISFRDIPIKMNVNIDGYCIN